MPNSRKKISVLTACFNEEENIFEIYSQVKEQFDKLPQYDYEHVFIDNDSGDGTVDILRDIAANDSAVRVIVNSRNFGHVRSPYHGILQCRGEAVIYIVADLQDPPEMIPRFLEKWEEGYKIVIGVKEGSEENYLMYRIRSLYYDILERISEVDQIKNYTCFGLYDQSFVALLRTLDDPYPYLRGQVAEFGFNRYAVPYKQPRRKAGETKNNFYTLYDMAMNGFVNHSKVPLRLAGLVGFISAGVSFLTGFFYLIYKLMFWDEFDLGIAPMVIGFFFFSSIQLIFIGMIGEYVGAVYTQVKKRPLVIERERINFDKDREDES